MRPESRTAFEAARAAHAAVYEQLIRLRRVLDSSGDAEELCDAVYALRETSALLDDARKETDKLKELFEKLCCLSWLATDGSPIRTDYCTGSPDVRQAPITPRPDTPEYAEMCKHFGIDPTSPFRPHWPTMVERVTEDARQGRPLPPGVDPAKTLSVFKVSVRKKRPIIDDEDEDAALQEPEVLRAVVVLSDALDTGKSELIESAKARLVEQLVHAKAEKARLER